jgi:nickel/cobalt exporter
MWQFVLLGLRGGLTPSPAEIAIPLLGLQLKQLVLGVALVASFSVGLAVTMVSVGVIASLSVTQVQGCWPGFGCLARRAPCALGGLMLLVAIYMAGSGGLACWPILDHAEVDTRRSANQICREGLTAIAP